MIETGVTLLRLLLGLGAVFFLGYALAHPPGPPAPGFHRLGARRLQLRGRRPGPHLLDAGPDLVGGALQPGTDFRPPPGPGRRPAPGPPGPPGRPGGGAGPPGSPPVALQGWDWLFLGLLALVFLYALPRAALYPMWAWDAVATWGCKARIFYVSRGLDLTCIEAHNYYPNLVPLLLSYLYFALGRVNDSLAKVIFPLWGALLLGLLYSLAGRLGLSRRRALGLAAFLALNGTVFIVHLYIAYADLPLAFFTLAGAGLLYLWLADAAPRGSLTLSACCLAGMAWCKYEGPPLAATLLLAAALTLAWLARPAGSAAWDSCPSPLAGLILGYLPWRLFIVQQKIEIGADHIQGFYPHQMVQAIYYLLAGLVDPFYFGFLWPALALALILAGKRLWRSPMLFLALFVGGNLLAIILAYAVAPTGAAEFPAYVRATLDRLLLHLTPVAALLLALGLNDLFPTPKSPPAP